MADNTTLTAELSQRIILPLTADNIDAVGDRTARTKIAAMEASYANLLAQVQILQGGFRMVYFASATYSVTEGNSGTTLLTATMKRTGDLSQALAVPAKFVQGTLAASDFVGGTLPGDLVFNFAAGADTATASDQIKGDTEVEGTETLTRVIVPPPGYLFGPTPSYTGSVLNDDTATTPANGDMSALRVRDATQMDTHDNGTNVVGIDGNGWVAEVTIKGMTPPAADNTSDGFFNCQKLELLVADPGFRESAGAMVAATVYRKIKGRALLRKQYKTASTDVNGRFITQSGSDFVVLVALADQIYAGSTIVSAKVAAGFYTNGSNVSNASVASSLTNASTYAYKKPTAALLNHQHLRATGDLPVELIAFHRHAMGGRQVAGVKFQARDTTGNVSAEVIAAATSLSGFVTATGSPKAEAFKATIPVAALAQGEMCYVNAKVYPWIGDASAVYDLSVDGTYTDLTRIVDASPHTRLRFLCDKNGTYSGVVLVDANVVYTPICSSGSFSPATTAFDGNYSSGNGWLSQNGGTNQWVGQTFPSAVNIEEVRIWANGYDAATTFNNFDLEWSDDGTTNWTKKGATQTAAAWTTKYTQTQTFTPGGAARPARYWRIRQNGAGPTGNFTGAQEIEFASTVGGVNIANGAAMATLADARTLPVTTPDAAFKAIRALNVRKGHDDYAGGRIYLGNTTANTIEYGALANIPSPPVMGLTWCEIMPDPAATGAVKWTGKAANVAIPSMTRAVGLTIKTTPGQFGTQTTFSDPDSATGYSMLSLESCVFEASSVGESIASPAGISGYNIHYRSNCTSAQGGVLGMAGNARSMALALGNVQPQGATPPFIHVAVANRSKVPTETVLASGADGYFLVNNEWRYAEGPTLSLFSKTRPTVIVGNLGECYGNGSTIIAFNMAADGVSAPVNELLEMHNTFLGNRGSRMYSDRTESRGVVKEGVSILSVWGNYNFKTDSFDPNQNGSGLPGNTGNWRYGYQVGLRSNISLLGSLNSSAPNQTSSYLGMAWEPDYSTYLVSSNFADIMALFNDYEALRNDNGTYPGNGNYRPASKTNALSNRAPAAFASFNPGFTDTLSGAVLGFDMDGKARRTDGTGAAGCYES